jgi:release factor family 10
MFDTNLLNSLGNHWSEEETSVSFYFSEANPMNRAHSGAMIRAKELARNILHANQTPELRGLVERLERRVDQLQVSQSVGLAIFAAPPAPWIEIELPFAVKPQSFIERSFVLAPLLPMIAIEHTYFILLVDRSVSRLFRVERTAPIDQMKEVEQNRRKIRETGTSRKISDERSKDDEAYHHLRRLGEHLLGLLNREAVDNVYLGCRNELRAEIQAAMPEGLIRKIAGYFPCDPNLITAKQTVELVTPKIQEREQERLQEVFDTVKGEAARNGRGAIGPRKVIRSLERGEIQTIVIMPHTSVAASECTSCKHIDLKRPATCLLCGGDTRRYADLTEILVRRATKGAFGLLSAPEQKELAEASGFLAKLRFRADQSRTEVA